MLLTGGRGAEDETQIQIRKGQACFLKRAGNKTRPSALGMSDPGVGVGDGHREMHRLHDVLQFFETSLKNRIVKN